MPSKRRCWSAGYCLLLTRSGCAASWQSPDPMMQAISHCALLDGEQDVWLASCGNFYSSPFSIRRIAMPNTVLGLPRLPQRGHYRAQAARHPRVPLLRRRSASRPERRPIGPPSSAMPMTRIVQQILPAFGDDVVARARRRSRLEPPGLPARLRHGHDRLQLLADSAMIVMPSRCLCPHPCAPASIARISRDTAIRLGSGSRRVSRQCPALPCHGTFRRYRRPIHCRCPAPDSPCAAQCRSARAPFAA
jgi:hypothetical protein